jgi:hypothetical protein
MEMHTFHCHNQQMQMHISGRHHAGMQLNTFGCHNVPCNMQMLTQDVIMNSANASFQCHTSERIYIDMDAIMHMQMHASC